MTDENTPTETTTPVVEPAAESTALPDWATDPAAAFKMVNDLRAENARDRTAAKEAAAQQARMDLLKTLGLKEDDKPVTPEAHQAELAARDNRIRELTLKNALTDALTSSNARPIARAAILGDNVLADLDPSSSTFNSDVASKVSAYLISNPELKATGQAPASSGTDSPGGNSSKPTYTRAQLSDNTFYRANKADIEAAFYDGRIID